VFFSVVKASQEETHSCVTDKEGSVQAVLFQGVTMLEGQDAEPKETSLTSLLDNLLLRAFPRTICMSAFRIKLLAFSQSTVDTSLSLLV